MDGWWNRGRGFVCCVCVMGWGRRVVGFMCVLMLICLLGSLREEGREEKEGWVVD